MSIGLTRNTANKLQKLLAASGVGQSADRPTQGTAHYCLVRCISQEPASEDPVESECYSGVIVDPESPVSAESFNELTRVWLTILGPNGPEIPVRDTLYVCRQLGRLTVGEESRPRCVSDSTDHAGPVWVCGRAANGQGWLDSEGESIDSREGFDQDELIKIVTAISTTNPTLSGSAVIAQIKLPTAAKGTRWHVFGHARVLVTIPSGSSDTWYSGSGLGSGAYGFFAQLYSRSVGGSNARYRTLWAESPFRTTINAGHASEAKVTFGNIAQAGGTGLLVRDWPVGASDATIVDLQLAWNFTASIPGASGNFTIQVTEWELHAIRSPSTQSCCYEAGDDPPTIAVDTVETDPEATAPAESTGTLVYTLLISDAEDGFPTDAGVDHVGDIDVLTEADLTNAGSGLWTLTVKTGVVGHSTVRVYARDSRGQVAYWDTVIYVVEADPEPETP